jgi:hypothetical protein
MQTLNMQRRIITDVNVQPHHSVTALALQSQNRYSPMSLQMFPTDIYIYIDVI